jgi:hypothetical protein
MTGERRKECTLGTAIYIFACLFLWKNHTSLPVFCGHSKLNCVCKVESTPEYNLTNEGIKNKATHQINDIQKW